MNFKGHLITGLIFGIISYIYFFRELSFIFFPALVVFILGSLAPDIDLIGGIGHHRSWITHSPLILLLSVWVNNPYLSVFISGWAIHLLADSVNFSTGDTAPGDIRGVPEGLEFPLLIGGAILLLASALFNPGIITLLKSLF